MTSTLICDSVHGAEFPGSAQIKIGGLNSYFTKHQRLNTNKEWRKTYRSSVWWEFMLNVGCIMRSKFEVIILFVVKTRNILTIILGWVRHNIYHSVFIDDNIQSNSHHGNWKYCVCQGIDNGDWQNFNAPLWNVCLKFIL